MFERDHGGTDLLGKVYEYFIGQFAASEGKKHGDARILPNSFPRLLVALAEPPSGRLYDPCCGAGSMFVHAEQFTRASRDLSFYGQESKELAWRVCRMNLFIHGLEAHNVRLGNSYFGG